MATRRCNIAINCPGGSAANVLDTDSPLANFSSELPDEILFTSTGFPIWNPDNPLNIDGPGDPSFPPLYFAEGCVGPALSAISQDDANAIAARQAIQCEYNKQKPTPPLFFNAAQQCSFTCPDGSLYTFTVEPGFVVAGSQSLADRIAEEIACQRAAADYICLGTLSPTTGCLGVQYSATVALSSRNPPLSVSVGIGSLPPGLLMSQSVDGKSVTLSGTPTTAGNFSFSLHATDGQGNFHDKMYTIDVVGITNIASIPSAMENTAYSTQLNGAGGTAPFTFVLTSGSLPGITLSSSGLLSGTPNYVTAGSYPFTVQITDSSGIVCSQSGTLKVTLRPGPDWTQLVWSQYQLNSTPGHATAQGQGIKNTAFGNLIGDGVANPTITPVAAAGVTYTGPQVTSRIILTITNTAPFDALSCRVLQNGAQPANAGYGGAIASGTYNFDFFSGPGVGLVYTIDDASPGNKWASIFGGAGTLSFTWAIVNV